MLSSCSFRWWNLLEDTRLTLPCLCWNPKLFSELDSITINPQAWRVLYATKIRHLCRCTSCSFSTTQTQHRLHSIVWKRIAQELCKQQGQPCNLVKAAVWSVNKSTCRVSLHSVNLSPFTPLLSTPSVQWLQRGWDRQRHHHGVRQQDTAAKQLQSQHRNHSKLLPLLSSEKVTTLVKAGQVFACWPLHHLTSPYMCICAK